MNYSLTAQGTPWLAGEPLFAVAPLADRLDQCDRFRVPRLRDMRGVVTGEPRRERSGPLGR